jgi:hypothetical protein
MFQNVSAEIACVKDRRKEKKKSQEVRTTDFSHQKGLI